MAIVEVIPLEQEQEQMAQMEDDFEYQGPPSSSISIFIAKSTCVGTVMCFSSAHHRICSCIHTQFQPALATSQ